MLSSAHAHGCSCNVCSGPSVWNTVLEKSLPSLPPPVDLGPGPRKLHGARQLSVANAQAISPERDIEAQSAGQKQAVATDSILCGSTKSPITLEDFTAYLKTSASGERTAELVALDFLMVFRDYRSRFFALPTSEQAPHPYSVIESLSKLSMENSKSPLSVLNIQDEVSPLAFKTDFGTSEVPVQLPSEPAAAAVHSGSTGRNRSGSSASNSSIPLNRQSAHTRAAMMNGVVADDDDSSSMETLHSRSRSRSNATRQSTLPMILDPESQPLRAALQVIIDSFLSGPSSTLLMTIVTPSAISLALSETELTTHPSTLEPIANVLTAHFNSKVVPQFFNAAVINLSKATARGRLMMAILIFVIGVALSTVFIVKRNIFPRWSRLALTPFFVASIGYVIGSQTSLCFWLAWRGTREAKVYEESDVHSTPSDDRGRISDDATLADLEELGLCRTRSDAPVSRVKTYSIYTINHHEKHGKLSPLKTFLFDHSKNATSVASVRPPNRTERLIRMTGTATGTMPVEDASVRRAQVLIAVKVTIWLALGTVAAMAVVVAIP